MAINTFNVTSGANFIQETWSAEIEDAVQAETNLSDLVDRRYEKEMKFGDIIRINDDANLAVRMKATDTTATLSNATETQQSITINLHAYCAFLVEDVFELQAKYEIRSHKTEKISYALVSFIEGDLTSGLASLPSSFSQTYGTLGVDPTQDDLLACVNALDTADVPQDGRFWYGGPSFQTALLKMAVFTSADYVGADAAATAQKKGRVGRVYGAPVHISTLANNNPGSAGQSYVWYCHKRGVALIVQQAPKIHTDYTILETGWTVLGNTIYNFAERLILPKTAASVTPNDNFNSALAAA
ncbi:MAG: hypothetical protein NUW01_20165 [Gemmatimonadaceae bacterium]|nr:hypothetical protein [Gemmatimonadaceae bacterium]